MIFTLSGIITLVRPEQPLNALTPITSTLLGIVKVFIALPPSKAASIITLVFFLNDIRTVVLSYPIAQSPTYDTPFSVSMILEQFLKASSPILITLSGIEIFFREEQLENAAFPIVKRQFDVLTVSRDLHILNAFSSKTVTVSGMYTETIDFPLKAVS